MTIEQLKEYACDHICKWPSEFKDPDDLINQKCGYCKLEEGLDDLEAEMENLKQQAEKWELDALAEKNDKEYFIDQNRKLIDAFMNVITSKGDRSNG